MTNDELPKETKTNFRIRIKHNFNGFCSCKYRWSIEEEIPNKDWQNFESGCAFTFLGAKWLANSKVNKQIKGRANRKEWVFNK